MAQNKHGSPLAISVRRPGSGRHSLYHTHPICFRVHTCVCCVSMMQSRGSVTQRVTISARRPGWQPPSLSKLASKTRNLMERQVFLSPFPSTPTRSPPLPKGKISISFSLTPSSLSRPHPLLSHLCDRTHFGSKYLPRMP